MWNQFKTAFHRVGFWLLIFFLVGVSSGGYLNYRFNEWQMKRNVQLKGLIFEETVYNLSVRP